MSELDFSGRLFLVTGASSGIGWSIASQLALRYKAALVVTARRGERLQELRNSIGGVVPVQTIAADLADPEGPEQLHERAARQGPIFGLVNAAGATYYGRTTEIPRGTLEKLHRVDLLATIKLSLLCGRDMAERGEGAILNITSMAAFLPGPYQSVYTACKGGAHGFSRSFGAELRRHGVTVCSLAPGGVDTEMIGLAGLDRVVHRHRGAVMSAERVAEIGLKALSRKRALCVPGFRNKLMVHVSRWIPESWLASIAERVYRPDDQQAQMRGRGEENPS